VFSYFARCDPVLACKQPVNTRQKKTHCVISTRVFASFEKLRQSILEIMEIMEIDEQTYF
jgi:hypothetical protein